MKRSSPPVLLVEDDPDDEELTLLELGRAKLENPVDIARDGQEALDYLLGSGRRAPQPAPAVILLDLKLPRIGGLEVLQRVRTADRTRHTPVVILTSSRQDTDLLDGYHLGANSYVCKPIASDEFRAAISQLGLYWLTINQPAPRQDDGARSGDAGY
jgi:two-component system, response regulator